MSSIQITTNETDIKRFAIYLKCEYDEQSRDKSEEWCFRYRFPFTKIHDIAVDCDLHIDKRCILFNINAMNVRFGTENYVLFHKYKCNRDNLTLNDYETFIDGIFKDIENLEFNKLDGKFELHKSLKLNTDVFNFIRTLPHIKMSYDKCCVCLENTKIHTLCNHYLCVECWGKIDIKYCDECEGNDCSDADCNNECGIKPCPLCRQNIEKE